jgi:hypothetical protein
MIQHTCASLALLKHGSTSAKLAQVLMQGDIHNTKIRPHIVSEALSKNARVSQCSRQD